MLALAVARLMPSTSEIGVDLWRRDQLLSAIESPPIVRSSLIEREPDWWRMLGRKFVMDDSIDAPSRFRRESFERFVPGHDATTKSTKAGQC